MGDSFAPTHRTIHCNGLRLHVVQAGPASGPPVVLLHGFPDFWIGWRPQMEALAEAGFRVIVPDQRGYNLSDKPKGIGAFALPKLVGDVLALSDALGHERFDLVGHDWGGIVAWTLAAKAPHRLGRLAILNAPHPEALFPHALRSPTQFLRSGYAAFFQFPLLPEAMLGARRFAVMVGALRQTGRPDAFTSADLDLYREAWSRPGALTGMLNWYRALRLRPRVQERITVPTLVLWGLQDTTLEPGLADRSLRFCDDGRLETFRNATHWLHREEPGRVNVALLSFLKSWNPIPRSAAPSLRPFG